jgi:glycosyltransferase involved in cell wall biosynthesis
MAPLRFLLVSTHTEQVTGYSKVSHNLLKQLATLHPIVKIFHFGFQRSPARTQNPMRTLQNVIQYDAAANEEPREHGFGFNKFKEYVETVTPDIIMIYNDPIIVNQFLNAIKDAPKTYKIWVYLDQVYEGADMGLLRNIENTADRILCFTESWKAHLKTRLTTATLPIDVMEHGVDQLVFKPASDGERMAIRKQLNLGMDAKVILNINRNSQRKRLDLSIMAFVRLLKKNPDAPLYMVFITSVKPEGGAYYNPLQIYLNELEKHGLEAPKFGTRLLTIDTTPPTTYYNDDTINQLYNACDIGINTANGEGFGLCQLEHLATGAPQVVLDLGGYRAFMSEEVAAFAPITAYEYMQQGAGVGLIEHTSTPELVCEALEKALAMLGPDRLAETREKCIQVAKSRPWSKICDAFLESIIQTKV